MLDFIQLTNFQKHEKLRIDFDPHITTIIGPSDVGKSAIVRAIRWVVFNRPNGKAFVRNGSKDCSVRLGVDGTNTITREWRGGSNRYKNGGEIYEAFGTSVPDPISNCLQLSEANLQRQLDSVFWFSDSAGEVSRKINSIVDLSTIDKCLSNIASKLRNCSSTILVTENRLQKVREKRDSLSYVLSMVEGYNNLVILDRAQTETAKSLNAVRQLIANVQTYQDTCSLATGKQKTLASCVSKAKNALDTRKQLNRVQSLRESIENTKERLKKCQKDIQILQNEIATKTQSRCPLCGGSMEKNSE